MTAQRNKLIKLKQCIPIWSKQKSVLCNFVSGIDVDVNLLQIQLYH
jgi:hypothetical protein